MSGDEVVADASRDLRERVKALIAEATEVAGSLG